MLESAAVGDHADHGPHIRQDGAEAHKIDGGGCRRDHLRALAQRVEMADKEVRIMGSKGDLLRTLAAASGGKPASPGVRGNSLTTLRDRRLFRGASAADRRQRPDAR